MITFLIIYVFMLFSFNDLWRGMDSKSVTSNNLSLITQLFGWWFLEMPKNIYSGTIQTAKNVFNYFSILLLLKTLFMPWKRDVVYAKNLSLFDQLQIFGMNLVSRIFGAIVRLAVIFAGLIIILIELILGFLWLLIFVLSPLIGLLAIIISIII